MKKKILFSLTSQFGYHTDTYMYCKYLDKTKYEVHYVGFDSGYIRRDIEGVHVHYISLNDNKIKRYWIYLTQINKLIRKENFDVVFQVDHKLTLLVRLCNLQRRFILDIRTGNLNKNRLIRLYYNLYIYFTSLFYKRVTVISESLLKLLKLSKQKTTLIPLGAESKNYDDKSWENLYLFYIGTLDLRRIYETITGVSIFSKRHPEINISYDIIGTGKDSEVKKIKQTIVKYSLEKNVILHGRKNHDEIISIWEHANIGVVYIPITPYYNCQPSTKLYECLLAGMPVIATNTFENRREIGFSEGVLIQDNDQSFADGLEEIMKNKDIYNSTLIKEKFKSSTWQHIVIFKLQPLLDVLLKQ